MKKINFEEFRKKEYERRERCLKFAKPQKLIKNNPKKDILHIVYVMHWTETCGGSKIILQHANKLVENGQNVTIISHCEKPEWFDLNEKVNFEQIPFDRILGEGIPDCDVIVTTTFSEVYESIEQEIAPVVHFEQGSPKLFAQDKYEEEFKIFAHKQVEVVRFILTVSSYAKEKIKDIYNRDAHIVHNAIDSDIFYPKKRNNRKKSEIAIAIIGSIDWEFKCIGNILEAIEILRDEGHNIKINWISRNQPDTEYDVIVNPPQIVIGDTLRESDIYICASRYESFCLPVLEAMSCGTAVITTDNGGIRDWVVDGENALVIKRDSVDAIVRSARKLIRDRKLRNKLAVAGVNASKKFNWKSITNELIDYYREVACYSVIKEEE